jgi:hypothetical protein
MKANSKMTKTNFVKHDQQIKAGEATAFDGWLNAGVECYERFGGNASAYAKSAVSLRWTGKNTLSQTENTIRQYVSSVVRLMRKHKTKAGVLSAYDAVYETREIKALQALAQGSGQRKEGKKRSTSAVALTKRSAHNAWNKAKSFDEFWELVSE